MKKKLSTIICFYLFLNVHFSQTPIKLGVRTGVNLATYHYNYTFKGYTEQPKYSTLLTIAFPVDISLSRHFTFQPELNFTQKGYKFYFKDIYARRSSTNDIQLTTNWLELAILGKLKFQPQKKLNISLLSGISLGYALNGQIKNSYIRSTFVLPNLIGMESKNVIFEADHEIFDIGFNLGTEIMYKNRYIMDIRYQLGLTDTKSKYYMDYRMLTSKTRGIALTLGYRFGAIKR